MNLANGNLYISSNDLTLTSPGVSTQLTRHYNSLDTTSGSLGTWSSQHGDDVRLDIGSNSINLRGPSGFNQSFTLEDGEWTAPAGLNATIAPEGDGWKVTFIRTGQQMSFSAAGLLTKDADRNGVGNSYGYTNGALSTIVDAAGRQTQISRAGNSTIYTTPDGRTLEYAEDETGNLTTVTLNARNTVLETITLDYDDNGKLSWMSTPNNLAGDDIGTAFTYDSDGRVAKIRQTFSYNGGTRERETQFEYGTGSTTVIDPSGERSTFTLDDMGRITSATDQLAENALRSGPPTATLPPR